MMLSVSAAWGLASEFGSQGEHAGQFNDPIGVAVAQAGGDVYLADRENNRAERWNKEGGFVSAWGWGVLDGVTEAFQTCSVSCAAGLAGSGAGQFGERPAGVAVDNSLGLSHGDVYVVDRENLRVEQFSAAGEFLLMFGGEVNATTKGDVCLAGEACKAGVASGGLGSFQGLAGNDIAVDSTGTVYVGDSNRVQKFTPAGVVEEAIALPGVGGITALAVDSAKDLYVKGTELIGVRKYNGAGAKLGEPRDATEGAGRLIAVGPADELFIEDPETEHIFKYSPGGELLLSLIEHGSSGGIAFGEEQNVLYVLHSGVVRALTLPPAGPVVEEGSESADELQPTGATLHATVNPEGPQATKYHFEYGPTISYGSSTPSQPLPGGAFEDQPVNAAVTGLSPSTTYHFRVVATNALSQTTFGADGTFTTLPAVSIDSESAFKITATSAHLATQLNPHGLETEYHFEYGRDTSYGTVVPIPDAEAGSGSVDIGFDVLIEGLAPDTAYHYRVIAHNALGSVEGTDRVLTTQGPEPKGMLDGRAWELVSPPNKHGVSLESIAEEGSIIQAAADGHALAYIAKAPVEAKTEGNRSIANTQLLAARTGSGWSTQDVTTPHESVVGLAVGSLSEYKIFSEDLSVGFVEPFGSTPLSPQATERTPYRREANGKYTPLVNPGNTPPGTKFGGEETNPEGFVNGAAFVLATPDGSHVILSSATSLIAEVPSGPESLYEWSDGSLELMSVLPNGASTAAEGATTAVGVTDVQMRGALSEDGARLVFTASGGSGEHLFVRDAARQESIQLDVPVAGARGGAGIPAFQLANGDGSKVFFTDEARLTVGSTAAVTHPDLYMCEVKVIAGHLSCALKDLTVDGNPGESADVLGGVIGSDEAGKLVYFAANGALAPGAVHGECQSLNPREASASALCNLYLYDTVTESTRLVAVVSNRDGVDWGAEFGGRNLGSLSGRVSGNGQWFTFMSQRPLTGFDNRDARSGEADVEVFLFDADTGDLTCVSCNTSDSRPVGTFDNGQFPGLWVDRPRAWGGQWLAGLIPGWTRVKLNSALYQSRFLSDDGRLFFDSSEGLVAIDANGVMDVYEFEPLGVGGCDRAPGCVGLVSSGESGEESAFFDASANGDDVFFLTAGKLVGADTDAAFDIYDAHVCSTAVPCPSAVVSVPPACSNVDSCRAAPPPQPGGFGPPASSTFSGSGNVTTPPRPKVVKPLTRAQKLAKALSACKHKPKRKRASCRAQAKKRYGSAKSARKGGDGRKRRNTESRRGG